MKNIYRIITTLLLFTGLAFSAQANQELTPSNGGQYEQSGRYQIHYMALPTTILTAQVATTYGIKRSRYNGFVNIAILDTLLDGNPAVSGKVTGSATNLTGKQVALTFTQIKEGDAIYYIAQLPFHHKEQFTIQVRSTNRDGLNSNLKFIQQFYVQ